MSYFCNNDELKDNNCLCKMCFLRRKAYAMISDVKEELFLILYVTFMIYAFLNAVNRVNFFSDIVNSLVVFSPLLLLFFSRKLRKTTVILPAFGGLVLALMPIYATIATYDISYGTAGLLPAAYWALKNHALYPLITGITALIVSIIIYKRQNKTYGSVPHDEVKQ